jgi:putative membrane protein
MADLFLGFGLYFVTALVLTGLFLYLYALVTPYDDYELIFHKNNTAAALGFGGAIVGVATPMYSALVHSVSYGDFVVWGAIAIAIQLLFALVATRVNTKFSVVKQIESGVVPVGVLMAFLSIAIGLLNAGSMSY